MDVRTAVEAAVDELEAALTHLQDASLDSCPDHVVESVARRLEVVRRRLDSVDVAVVGAVEQRGIPFAHGCKTTATWLRYGLHVDPTEATRRVKAFERLGTRVCGSVVAGPVFPAAASALAEGAISTAHVRVIAEAVEKLPDEIAALHDRELETQLVAHARTMDPRDLGTAADRACYLLDQDGKLAGAKSQGTAPHARPAPAASRQCRADRGADRRGGRVPRDRLRRPRQTPPGRGRHPGRAHRWATPPRRADSSCARRPCATATCPPPPASQPR